MNRKIAAGAAAGLIAGLAFDVAMRAIPARTGGSMITFAATAVHSTHPLAGWLAYAVYGVLIGALFGWLVANQPLDDGAAMVWGGLYGLGWWIVAGLVLLPALRPAWPFSITAIDQAREVAFPLLIGHVVYGVILGLAWSEITRRGSQRRPSAAALPRRHAA